MLHLTIQRVDSVLRASDALRRRVMKRAWYRLRHPANVARMLSVDGMTRKADSEWKKEIGAGKLPARPEWTKRYLVPGVNPDGKRSQQKE